VTGAGKYRSVSYYASKEGGNDIERQNVLFVIYEQKALVLYFAEYEAEYGGTYEMLQKEQEILYS
jgi:hypothetical protein